ncbi:EARP and GARP complex-interacting protein 1 [Geodia barretti]|nr:EARP and GARP complex-interacting protein 1 [Geodia barretti]
MLDYDDDTGVLDRTSFPHPAGEVWDIASCPGDSCLVSTVFSKVGGEDCQGGVGVWRMEGEGEGEGEGGTLQEVCLLTHDGVPKCSVWSPTSSRRQLATVDDKTATLWTLEQASASVQSTVQLDGKGRSHGYCSSCWNPHHNHSQLLVSCDSALHCWDLRSQQMAFSLDAPHGLYDCRTKFWDARKLTTPLLCRQDHSHWIWSVQYNLFHDQLVLTASSDSQVVLSRLPSIASEPLRHIEPDEGEEDEERPPSPMTDDVIRTFEEHEDSVYEAVWSSADAWVFASLSYDGRLVINHVPTQEKFAILTS